MAGTDLESRDMMGSTSVDRLPADALAGCCEFRGLNQLKVILSELSWTDPSASN